MQPRGRDRELQTSRSHGLQAQRVANATPAVVRRHRELQTIHGLCSGGSESLKHYARYVVAAPRVANTNCAGCGLEEGIRLPKTKSNLLDFNYKTNLILSNQNITFRFRQPHCHECSCLAQALQFICRRKLTHTQK